jgi:FMN phosphatase YigB (HAD superfamily)
MVKRITRNSIQSALRLAIGVLRLPFATRTKHGKTQRLISIDIFATLIRRCCDDGAAWRDGAFRVAETARQIGLRGEVDPIRIRREIEFHISTEMIASGNDPEFSHTRVIEEMLRHWGAEGYAAQSAIEIARWEFEREIAYTTPVPEIVRLVSDWAAQGKRVVAVSDTRYTGQELNELLTHHSIAGIAAIYSSADFGRSKFSGRLFDEVAKAEATPLNEILHIGDDVLADVLSPAQKGLSVRRVRKVAYSSEMPTAPSISSGSAVSKAFLFGYDTLGPILVAFTRLLFAAARRDKIERLAFVARDGELLLRVAQSLRDPMMELSYLEVSRRAIMCTSPELHSLDGSSSSAQQVTEKLNSIRSSGSFLERFHNFYGIPAELVLAHAQKLRIVDGTQSDLVLLLTDRTFLEELHTVVQNQTNRIYEYLAQEKALSSTTALVDIGWRGSVQALIERGCRLRTLSPPKGYYFGLWNEDSGIFPEGSLGIVSDQRRGRTLLEGSAWHVAFLLEAACRAQHGMVNGFREDSDGVIRATFVSLGEARRIEQATEDAQLRIQDGVIAYVSWFANTFQNIRYDESALRQAVQRRLYKLAFFPNETEIFVGRQLAHSEPTSDEIALPLILSTNFGAAAFLHGIRSPWKGGFFRASAGHVGAVIYATSEAILCRFPLGLKSRIRKELIRD